MDESAFLLVGLGNPGTKYENTPHNVGFKFIDLLAERWGAPPYQKKFRGLITEARHSDKKLFLLKPQTYMNLSGQSVSQLVRFYKLQATSQMLVVLDDIDLPLGALRLRKKGGTGGHNGLKSIRDSLGTDGFARLRLGVGRSEGADPSRHVLGVISAGQRPQYETMLSKATEGVEKIFVEGIDKAMNQVNQREENR